MEIKWAIFIALALLGVYFTVLFVKDLTKNKSKMENENDKIVLAGVSGFVTNFFDALGIGNFGPLTSIIKIFKITDDRLIPGTLNVSLTICVMLEAFLYIKNIQVSPITLVSMIASATFGGAVGAKFISKLDEKKIELIMGFSLLIVMGFMLCSQLGILPSGGTAIGLTGWKLVVAVIVNFFLGTLMTAGIGLYAPCMALIFALGMSPKVAFPIMMGSSAFLMPAASVTFIKNNAYARKVSVAICLTGCVGIFIATYLVKSLPLKYLNWLVIIVLCYTSISMFKSYRNNVKKDLEKQEKM